MILLDTNVLIDLDRYLFDETRTYGARILSRAELELGIQMTRTARDTAERTRRLIELDDIFDWLPFDVPATRSYGIVAAGARATGSARQERHSSG